MFDKKLHYSPCSRIGERCRHKDDFSIGLRWCWTRPLGACPSMLEAYTVADRAALSEGSQDTIQVMELAVDLHHQKNEINTP